MAELRFGVVSESVRDGRAWLDYARQIEDTVLWRPDPDSALEGTPNKFVFSKT